MSANTETKQRFTVERDGADRYKVSILGDDGQTLTSTSIPRLDWAALTADIDVPRTVIVEAPRGQRFDNADAFAKARETLPGGLCQTRIWWEDAAGRTVNWSDDSAVCTKWEFEEVLAA